MRISNVIVLRAQAHGIRYDNRLFKLALMSMVERISAKISKIMIHEKENDACL